MVEDPRNFHNSFFIKNYSLSLYFFFQVLQCALVKNKKTIHKKNASHLKIALHSKRQRKNTEKRETKPKNEKKPNNKNKYFFTFFYIENFIFCEETYLEKLSLYCYICITNFSRGRSLEMQ